MKKLTKKRKRQIRNILLFFVCCIVISCAAFGILLATKVIYFDNGIHFSKELFDSMRGQWYIYLVFLIIQVLLTIVLCFVPGTSAIMITLGVALFGANWKTFLLVFGGVILSSLGMDCIGRFGGSKIVNKLLGEEDYNSAMELIRDKGYTYLPFMYLLPLFPDDALCFCAGVSKIKLWYHYLIIVLCRGIGAATIVFGISILPTDRLFPITKGNLYEWFILLGVIIAYILALLKISRYIDKKVTKWLKKHEENKEK